MGLVTWRGCGACQFPPYPVSCEAGRRRSRQPAPPATRSQPTVGGVAGAVLGRQGQRPPAGSRGQCYGHRTARLSQRCVWL